MKGLVPNFNFLITSPTWERVILASWYFFQKGQGGLTPWLTKFLIYPPVWVCQQCTDITLKENVLSLETSMIDFKSSQF